MSKLLDLAKELDALLYHYEDDPQWKALRKKAKAAVREHEHAYRIELAVRVEKGGGKRKLIDELDFALHTSNARVQPSIYDIAITRREKNWWERLPMSKPCPAPGTCTQGMALEVDAYDPTGGTEGLPKEPAVRYRCQDCSEEETVTR